MWYNSYVKEALVMWRLSSQKMDTANRVQIMKEPICISHSANTLEKKYASTYYLSSYG